ncbi:hypothetical protein GCM10014713_28610 [Streptomyces purpureus]|uniref:Cobalamin-independent methionine synthase MetE C-terminal/archaeal domain-containing protein n=1 Tax=Streptomyces purpureus TaxID=1951 RepID=A0A918H3V5_9ACTN|nr:hypothetical protein GCM10014713_28610 [Streptomyces purpureus]
MQLVRTRPATSGVQPDIQIHTHMCYAEFGDIVQAIDGLDADVISLEAARSHVQVAHAVADHGYPREAVPGVWDIHSPRVPAVEEATARLRKGLEAIPAERRWIHQAAARRPAGGWRPRPPWRTSPPPARSATSCPSPDPSHPRGRPRPLWRVAQVWVWRGCGRFCDASVRQATAERGSR